MSSSLAWFVHLSNAAVGVTGLVYAWMRYVMEPSDPYAVVAHPAQPLVQHVHVWAAPLLVFALGLIWQQHVWTKWQRGTGARRRSGLVLMATAAPMIASGYLLQTAVEPGWRTIWIVVHLAASLLWIAGSLVHLAGKRNGSSAA